MSIFRNRLEFIKDNISRMIPWTRRIPLLFQDNLVDKFIAILNVNLVKNLIINNKILYQANINDFLDAGIKTRETTLST